MRYTRSALGLLNSQYRSILKKCFLINLGLFMLIEPAEAYYTGDWNYETEGEFYDVGPNPINKETKLSGFLDVIGTGPGDAVYFIGNENTRLFSIASGVTASVGGASVDYFEKGVGDSGGALLISTGGKFLAAHKYGYGYKCFNGNKATLWNGGAIYNAGTIIADGVELIFSGNTANQNGGAIANVGTIDSIVNNRYFSNTGFNNNQALGNTNAGIGVGGAIANEGSIGTINAYFSNNSAKTQGGAIYNGLPSNAAAPNSKTITTINGWFKNNTSSTGGAIYNNGTIGTISADFGYKDYNGNIDTTKGNSASANGGAIANDTGGSITTINSNFYANSSGGNGGAIWNYLGTISNINSSFANNSATDNGGAIFNAGKSGDTVTTINNILGQFIENSANAGGAIWNNDGGLIKNIGSSDTKVSFSSNQTQNSGNGGAILNNGTINNLYANFTTNTGWDGGAIYNGGTIDSIYGEFSSNSARGWGGAIYNKADKTIGIINASFNGNKAITAGDGNGGAIYNAGIISNYVGAYVNNQSTGGGAIANKGGSMTASQKSTFTNNIATKWGGGAILNSATMSVYGDFSDNKVTGTGYGSNFSGHGGAIYNENGNMVVEGTFTDNMAVRNGGAIYNREDGTVNIVAENGNTSFSGNKSGVTFDSSYNASGGSSNAIYNLGTINLSSTGTNEIIFDDTIDGSNGILNVKSGTVKFNNQVSGNSLSIIGGNVIANAENLNIIGNAISNNGVLTLTGGTNINDISGTGSVIIAGNVTTLADILTTDLDINSGYLAISDDIQISQNVNLNGGTLNLVDDSAKEYNLTNLNGFGGNLSIDVNLLTPHTNDTIVVNKADGTIGFTDINIISAPTLSRTGEIQVISGDDVSNLTLNGITVIYQQEDTIKFEGSTGTGKLTYEYVKANETLKGAVDYDGGDRIYKMKSDENVSENLGVINVANSTLTIQGNGYNILGNGYDGIIVDNGQTLNISDVKISGFKDKLAFTNNGILNLSGNNIQISDDINGSGTININGNYTAGGMISSNTLNVNSGTLNITSADTLASDVSVNINNGELNIENNNIDIKSAYFDANSILSLKVNSLNDHGSINAQDITIEEGAKLQATLAQGIISYGEGTKELTLLSATNGFTDNFAESFDNNMYVFNKKDGVDGVYEIKQLKTAAQLSEENGGTETNIGAAGAWIDGDAFASGSTEQGIADILSGLAQTDAKAMNEALSALAPETAPMVNQLSVNHSNLVFNMVNSQLRNRDIEYSDWGISSGDNPFRDASVWFKVYMGTSKLDDTKDVKGYDADSKGIVAGIEKQFNSVKTGIGIAHDETDVDGFNRDTDISTDTAFVYAEYKPNEWHINTTLSYNIADYDENKYVAENKYAAHYKVKTYGIQTLTGYEFSNRRYKVVPEVGMRYNHIKRERYTDSAGQNIASNDMNVLTAVAGVNMSANLLTPNCYVLRPELYIGATYDIISDRDTTLVSLANGAEYLAYGKRLNRFGVEVGTSVTAELSDNMEANAGYQGIMRKNYQNHTGTIGLKYKF